jgi:hypothetical protein
MPREATSSVQPGALADTADKDIEQDNYPAETDGGDADHKALRKLNGALSSMPKCWVRETPACPENIGTTWLLSSARSYIHHTLKKVAPACANDLLKWVYDTEMERRGEGPVKQVAELLSGMASVYLRTDSDDTRAIMFANLCGACKNLTELNKLLAAEGEAWSWKGLGTKHVNIGRQRYRTGCKLHHYLTTKGNMPVKQYGSRLKETTAFGMLHWIEAHCPLGWKPGVIKTFRVAGKIYEFNVLQRAGSATELWREYAKHKAALRKTLGDSSWLPGRGTFMMFLKYVTDEVRSLACLSYYYIRLLGTFDLYERLVSDMHGLYDESLRRLEEESGKERAELARSRLKTAGKDPKAFKAKMFELQA